MIISSLNCQIVITTNVINVPCCTFSDSLDYNSDGNYDISIYSTQGMDANDYRISGLGNVQVSYPLDFGQTFNDFASLHLLTGTSILCLWYNTWVPGTGTYKYVGFQDLSVPNDTIFGWVKILFNGIQNTCEDTMITSLVVYSQTPNTRLTAGQTTITEVTSIYDKTEGLFKINRSQDNIYIMSTSNDPIDIRVINVIGQEVYKTSDIVQGESMNLSNSLIPENLYLIIGESKSYRQTNKIYFDNNSR